MSEVEKLRALLADAAPCIDRAAAGCRTTKTLREIKPGECGCVACDIDAALAEPVMACCDSRALLQDVAFACRGLRPLSDAASTVVGNVFRERDEARAELDFIKAEYGGADDDSLTRDALLLKLRLLESEMDAERASRRMYERAHDDILEALKRAEADAYHPEDGEPVALWGVERLAKQRDEARAEVAYWKGEFSRLHEEHLPVAFAGAYRRGAEAMREAAALEIERQVDALMLRAGLAADVRDLPIPEDKP